MDVDTQNNIAHSDPTVAPRTNPGQPGPQGGIAQATRILEIDRTTFIDGFARRAFPVSHHLVDHPLLTLEAIAELADALPPLAIERHSAEQPLLVPGGAPELTGRPSDTVRDIETSGAWMVLWNIEQSPPYRDLLNRCLDEVESFVSNEHGGMARREAFLFLSAPNALTPAHFDPEHNLLLQIRGHKQMNVGRFPDRASELRELDRYHDGGHRNIEQLPAEAAAFEMDPGDGVYVYPFAPHWVRNGPRGSISLSITFRTAASERHERVHRFNARMRRLGLSPRPAGSTRVIDQAKAMTMGAAGRLRRTPSIRRSRTS
jgi:hypothetical protein